MTETKENRARADRNRTLRLTPTDRKRLASQLIRLPQHGSAPRLRQGIAEGDYQDWLPHLPERCVDLLFVDPPYNLNKSFGSLKFAQVQEREYTDQLCKLLADLMPLLKPTATVYLCGDWRSSHSIYEAARQHLVIRNRITWEREKGRGAKTNWKNCSEDIWFCTVSNEYQFDESAVKHRRAVVAPYTHPDGRPKDWRRTRNGNFRDTSPSNLWTDISVPFWSMRENTDHPTQKSEKLLAKLILASSRPGDFVLDPLAGSGTTVAVANKLARRALGIEINHEYCLWSLKRLELSRTDSSIQGYRDGVFWQRNVPVPKRTGLQVNGEKQSTEN